jgi:hypothetical protein
MNLPTKHFNQNGKPETKLESMLKIPFCVNAEYFCICKLTIPGRNTEDSVKCINTIKITEIRKGLRKYGYVQNSVFSLTGKLF